MLLRCFFILAEDAELKPRNDQLDQADDQGDGDPQKGKRQNERKQRQHAQIKQAEPCKDDAVKPQQLGHDRKQRGDGGV